MAIENSNLYAEPTEPSPESHRGFENPVPADLIRIGDGGDMDSGLMFACIHSASAVRPAREITVGQHGGGERILRWIRLELKAHRNSDVSKDDWVVFGHAPISNTAYHISQFRTGWRARASSRPDPLSMKFSEESDVRAWIDGFEADDSGDAIRTILPHDWWESGSEYRTAGLSDPAAAQVPETDLRDYTKSGYTTCAVSTMRPADLFARLWGSPYLHQLPERAENGTLQFAFPGVSEKPVRLYQGIDRGPIPDLLKASMWQALAGPWPRVRKDTVTKPEADWVGRPVELLVTDIFAAHINNLNRRYRRANKGRSVEPGFEDFCDPEDTRE